MILGKNYKGFPFIMTWDAPRHVSVAVKFPAGWVNVEFTGDNLESSLVVEQMAHAYIDSLDNATPLFGEGRA